MFRLHYDFIMIENYGSQIKLAFWLDWTDASIFFENRNYEMLLMHFLPCGILLQLMFQIVVPNVTKKDFCCRVHYHHPFIPCKWPFPLRVVVWVSQQYQNRVMEFKKRQKLCMLTSKYIIYPCFCHYDNTKVILVHIFLHIDYRDMIKNDIFTRGKNIAFYIFQLSHTNQVTDGDLQMMTLGRCMIVQRQIRPVLCLVHGSTKARDPAQMWRVRYRQSQMNTHWSKKRNRLSHLHIQLQY